jgi:hypothetical protein
LPEEVHVLPFTVFKKEVTMYKLKTSEPAFEVVDGKFAGRKYRHGQTYQEIPPEEKDKFDRIEQSAKTEQKEGAAPSDAPDTGGKKK